MLISEKLNSAINQQIGNEFGASIQYVAIASHFAAEGLTELAGLFFRQAAEERDHALRFVQYVIETGGKVRIPGVAAPRHEFATAEEAVRLSLEWERTVTRQINDLMTMAVAEPDYLAQNFLGWFVREQLEEVSSMDNLLRVVQRAGEKNLFYVEAYLARRAARPTAGPAQASD